MPRPYVEPRGKIKKEIRLKREQRLTKNREKYARRNAK